MPAAKNRVSAKSKAAEKPVALGALPDWPSFETLPYEDTEQTVTHLLPGQIITISNFWTPSLCKKYVAFLAGLPLTTTPGKPKKDEAVRINDRFQVDDPRFAERLWTESGLSHIVEKLEHDTDVMGQAGRHALWSGPVLGLNSNIRIYRYTNGQLFNKHYDESNQVNHAGVRGRTTWTMLLYLTTATGGETAFYPEPTRKGPTPEPVVVDLEVGACLLHRHYPECMLHEGREVVQGEKWVIRSDLVVKR